MKGLLLSILLCIAFSAQSQTFEMRLVHNGGGVIAAQMRVTSGVPPKTSDFLADLSFGICWPNSYGVSLGTITTAYNMKKATVAEEVQGATRFQRFAADNLPINFPANWVVNQWVTIMTIPNNIAGFGTGTFSLCPANLQEINISYSIFPAVNEVLDFAPINAGAATEVQIGPPLTGKIVAAEYFIDTDPGVGHGTAINVPVSGDTISGNFPLNVTGLSTGFHNLYVRGKNDGNRWGFVQRQVFYVAPTPPIPAPATDEDIVAAEYFIDTDPGVGNGIAVPVTAGATTSGTFSPNLTGLSTGFHNLYLRGRNAAGRWGFVQRQVFYIAPPPPATPSQTVVAAEYFVDTDPGVGNGTPVPVPVPGDTIIGQNVPITITQCLSVGSHRLYLRGKDATGRWGFYQNATFTIQDVEAALVSLVHQPASNCSITNSENFTITVSNTGTNPLPAGLIQMNIGVTGANTGNYGPFTNNAVIAPGAQGVIQATDIDLATAGANTITASFALCNDDPAGNTASIQVTGTANPIPTVNSIPAQSVCAAKPTAAIAFSGNTPGATYTWVNNNPAIGLAASGTGDIASFTAINAGNAPVTATITVTPNLGNCQGVPVSFNITVNPLPTVSIVGNLAFCPGTTTGLTAFGGNGTYLWSTNATTQSITVGTPGTYTVVFTDVNGCTDTESVTVIQRPAPNAAISGALSFCAGASTTLMASGGTTYNWSTGVGGFGANSIVVTAADTYTVTVSNEFSCTATATVAVTVNPLPTPAISGNLTYCAGGSTILTASGGTSYSWNTGAATAALTVSAAGTYTVVVTGANGCTASATASVAQLNLPNASISGTLSFCAGTSTILTASGGTGYAWNTGANTANLMVNAAGTYTVIVTGANGCTASATAVVTQNALPNVSISGSSTFCTASSTALTATGAATYVWSTGATTAVISVNTAGTYTVVGTGANGCTSSASVGVTESTSLNPAILGNRAFCIGSSTTLTAVGGASYVWSNSATTASIMVNVAGTYTVVATDAGGCTGTVSAVVTQNALPTAGISGNLAFCAGGSTLLTASGGTTYLWSTNATTAALTVTSGGTYTVTVTDINGCSSSTTSSVAVNPLPSGNGVSVPVCSGDGSWTLSLQSRISNGIASNFTWTFQDNPNVTGEANGSGDILSGNLVNTSNVVQSVFYTITPTAEATGCVGATFTIQVPVWPVPDITCPANISVNTAPGSCTVSQMLTHPALVTNNTNCPATLSLAFSNGSPIPGSLPTGGSVTPSGTGSYTFAKGQTTVTYTAMDASGNQDICSFTVVVTDNQAPAITCPANQTVAAGTTCSGMVGAWILVSKTDNCTASGSITESQSPVASTVLSGHNTAQTVTLTANDGNGNTASCTFTVTLKDVSAPSITCPANQTVAADAACTGTVGARVLASKTDNCTASGSITESQSPVASTVLSGHNTAQIVTLTANDGNGNTASCTFTVTLKDVIAPTIACPANQTVAADATCTGTVGARVLVSKTDNCTVSGSITESQSPVASTVLSGHNTAQTVTLTANDGNGNTASCTFTVTLKDVTAPTIACPADQTVAADAACAGIVGARVLVSKTDNCTASGSITESQSPVANTALNGHNAVQTVTLMANDGNGNTATCSFTVTLKDVTAPVIVCPANNTVAANSACTGAVGPWTLVSKTDNCSAAGSITQSQAPVSATVLTGHNTAQVVVLTATDGAGNTSTCSLTVTLKDVTAPTIACPPNATVPASNTCTGTIGAWSLASKSDNCSVAGAIAESQSPVSTTVLSGHNTAQTVTLTATDGAGNSTTCTFTVTLKDITGPAITCPANIMAVNSTVTYIAPVGTDNCGGATTTQTDGTGLSSGSTYPYGITTLQYTVTDVAGLTATCTFNVINGIPPQITCPANITTNVVPNTCAKVVTYTPPVGTDDEPNPVTTQTDNTGLTTGSSFPAGTTIQQFTVTDAGGLTTTCSFTVKVIEGVLPSIICPANITANVTPNTCAKEITYATPTASDNCAGVTLTRTSGFASGSAFPKGMTMVNWKATDASGNTAVCGFLVTVFDNQAPAINCPNVTKGTDPNLCTAVVTYPAPTIQDNCPGGTTVWVNGPQSGATLAKGQHTVTWKATDAVGLTKTCTFRITVNDVQAPTITCPSNIVKSTDPNLCSAIVTYDFATFTDNCPGGTVTKISGLNSGSAFSKGVNNVTFKATDAAGLFSVCTLTITVNDTQLPTITCPPNVSVTAAPGECSAVATYANPTATDNCSGTTVYLLSGFASYSVFPQGVTVNTWRAFDQSGTSTTCSFTVTVACGTGASDPGLEVRNALVVRTPQPITMDLSPNPASSLVTITVAGLTEQAGQLSVFDARGRVVLSRVLTAGQNTVVLDLTEPVWASGLYEVVLKADERVLTKRLVKVE